MEKRSYVPEKNTEEQFLSSAILDLERRETTYVYRQDILDKLNKIFDNLEIKWFEFYWRVRNLEAKKSKSKTGRPRKVEIS